MFFCKPVGGGLAHGDGGVEDVPAAVAALLEDLLDGLDGGVGGGVRLQLGDDPPHPVDVALQDLGEGSIIINKVNYTSFINLI